MHEMSLASDIVDTVVATAKESRAERVLEIHMTIGMGRDIVADLFVGLVQRLSRGTVAEGAEIVIESIPFMVCCKECNTIYHINVFDDSTWPCPHCKQKNYVLYSGMEFTIDRVIVDHIVDYDGTKQQRGA